MLQKTAQKGFTIVELLIVIVVIGILAALVLNTFAGVQQRARDTERQTDINAIATQLEVYYNDKGGYPQFTQIDTEAEALAAFPGLDAGALHAPGQGAFSLITNADPLISQYRYQAFEDAAKTVLCDVDDACLNFTLTYRKEGDNSLVTKNSLN